MGNWNISIRGVGSHHNIDNKTDADRMARRFVRELVEAGHNVTGAEITHGGCEVLVSRELHVTPGREDIEPPTPS